MKIFSVTCQSEIAVLKYSEVTKPFANVRNKRQHVIVIPVQYYCMKILF